MYRKNPRSAQPLLLTDVNSLPSKLMKGLHSSWATTFREEVLRRIDEDAFAVLYSEKGSRPNTPVNVLVGLEILKEGRHWSDEELYDHFCFDLQVRYALGCEVFGEEDFCLRTLYNFRRRVVDHALGTGKNLFATVFEQVTDSQMAKLKVRTEMQRLDSTMILSNASCTTHCLAPVAKVFYLYGGGRDAAGILGRHRTPRNGRADGQKITNRGPKRPSGLDRPV